MRYYIILFFSVLSFLYACNRSGAPGDIIPSEKMIPLLTEIYLIDGHLAALQQYPDTLYKYGTAKYLAVFKKFGTDSATFRKSYIFYCTQPKLMSAMDTSILSKLQFKTDSIRKLQQKHAAELSKKAPLPPAGPHVPSTFHPGAASGAYVPPQATVLSHGKVVPTNRPMSPMQRFREKQKPKKLTDK